MRATLTDEQQQLRAVVAELARDGAPDAPRAHGRVPVADHATRALGEGFAGLAVPEDRGGAGGGLVDLALVASELGQQVVASPFLGSVQAIQVALAAGVDVAAAAAGEVRWVLAADEVGTAPLGPWRTTVDAGAVSGDKARVAHVDDADALVVTAADDTVAVVPVPPAGDDGPQGVDLGRPVTTVDLDAVAATAIGDGAVAGLHRALVVQAAELVGIGRGAVTLAAAYANEREQFGARIGRFQGVAHQLADAFVAVENAWSLTLYAAWAIEDADASGSRAVHLARANAGEAAVFAAERATQVHGGIGITWEARPHLFLRRAVSEANRLGTVAWHRRRAARTLLTP